MCGAPVASFERTRMELPYNPYRGEDAPSRAEAEADQRGIFDRRRNMDETRSEGQENG